VDSRETDPVAFGQQWLKGSGFDLAYECVGADATLDTAVRLTRKGAKVMVMGVFEKNPAFPMNLLQEGERTLLSSQAYVDELEVALGWMERDDLAAERLITARIPLDRIVPDGFEALLANPDGHIKIALSIAGLD
jgi:(R,R)-butanediol dehydrogenase/meso-butanediol dehydrogenase/diacetyl reductase